MRIEYTANRIIFKNEIPYNFYILINFFACVTIIISMRIKIIAILRSRENFIRG